MAKKRKGGMVSSLIEQQRAQQAAQAAEAARVTQNNLTANRNVNLQGNNSPDIQTSVVGGEDTTLVGGSSTKRRRVTGALSSQLGINT